MLSESIIAIAAYNQRQEENERSLEILQSQYYDLRYKCERTLSYKNSFEFTEISKREQDAIKMQYQNYWEHHSWSYRHRNKPGVQI
jgi:hypothetical protein